MTEIEVTILCMIVIKYHLFYIKDLISVFNLMRREQELCSGAIKQRR
jgi:hypothetical protein